MGELVKHPYREPITAIAKKSPGWRRWLCRFGFHQFKFVREVVQSRNEYGSGYFVDLRTGHRAKMVEFKELFQCERCLRSKFVERREFVDKDGEYSRLV